MPSGERELKLALDKVKRPQVVAKKHNSNRGLLSKLLLDGKNHHFTLDTETGNKNRHSVLDTEPRGAGGLTPPGQMLKQVQHDIYEFSMTCK